MQDSEPKSGVLPLRLCSEIQLFDLCDLDTCSLKNGRYCPDPELLDRFEKIAEEELRTPDRYASEEIDDEVDNSFGDGYDNEFGVEDCEGGEDDLQEDEE